MTIWSDYQATPGDNNSPPPVGAPEGMPPSSVNDIMREMMSVIYQLGDQVSNTFAGLGDMSQQSSNNVNITGGTVNATLYGNGFGIANLNAGALAGIIPAGNLSGYYDIGVAHATTADQLGGIALSSLVPLGIIVMFYGDITTVDSTIWAVCDGTRGTPYMTNNFPRGAINASDMGTSRGNTFVATDTQGSHTHGGVTQPHTLIPAELPPHTHNVEILAWDRGGGSPGFIGPGTGNSGYQQFLTDGGNVANAGHTHPITTDGAHIHNVTVDPPSIALWFLMRVA